VRSPTPLGERLSRLTREGVLYERLDRDRVRCFACGHRCLIPPGLPGVCKVRFNEGGVLQVPAGYVAALQLDPVEKKPFFHALPGSTALSFGMLGCDYHCSYCFVPGTEVTLPGGSRPIETLFGSGGTVFGTEQESVALPEGLEVLTHHGRPRRVKGVFRHHYDGPLMAIRPKKGPEIHTTPDHEFLVMARAARGSPPPTFFMPASGITPEFDLLEPRAGGGFTRRPLDETVVLSYRGPVFNLEVEEDQTYLVHGAAVHNCQNWLTSQALRDASAVVPPREISPESIVRLALDRGARILTSTYNEPLITSEWAVEVFEVARRFGLVCSYVSNGNGTPEVLEYLRPHVSLYKVDLKSFRDRHYRDLGGTLEAVLQTIRSLHSMGIWVEIVTLVIPGFNDSDEELRDMARFIASVSREVPWHVTAFHKDYKMQDPDNTPVRTLLRAAEIGASEGLAFVYAGNLPGAVGRWENTYCPGCQAVLIERIGYRILKNRVGSGRCPQCERGIPGFWQLPQGAPEGRRPEA
jgi:pyruvate formate lyase activating enzyme